MPAASALRTAHAIGVLLFGASMLCSALPAAWVAVRLTGDVRERYWLTIALVALHIGVVAQALSAFAMMRPAPWILAQIATACAALIVFRVSPVPALAADTERGATLPAASDSDTEPIAPRIANALVGGAAVLGVLLSAVRQWRSPIQAHDDVVYHGPRVLFWLQQAAIAAFTSNNDRQVVFPYGAEIFLAWSLLFARWEPLARMVFWMALPLAAVGIILVCRQLGVRPAWSLAAAAVLVWTPLVRDQAIGIKPELWGVVFLLGAGFWLVRVHQASHAGRPLLWAAVFAVLAANTKFTLLTAPAAVVAWGLAAPNEFRRRRALLALFAGGSVALLCSGLAHTMWDNTRLFGHPLGPAAMRQVHAADLSGAQVGGHLARVSLELIDFPWLPGWAADAISRSGDALLGSSGLGRPLAGEAGSTWPGVFSYKVGRLACRYSLAGLLSVPCAFIALLGLRRHGDPASRGPAALAFLAIGVALPIVLFVRWQSNAGVPERFLAAAFALGVVTVCWAFDAAARERRWLAPLGSVLLAWTVVPLVPGEVRRAIAMPHIGSTRPYYRIAEILPAGARIIHFGGTSSHEYFLFAPRLGYPNRVFPWGNAPFDPDRLARMIAEYGVTHIVVEGDGLISFHWGGERDLREAVASMRAMPALQQLDQPEKGAVVFAVRSPAARSGSR
jgi:hypothetical protein